MCTGPSCPSSDDLSCAQKHCTINRGETCSCVGSPQLEACALLTEGGDGAQVDQAKRAGCGPKGVEAIRTHPYFKRIDWEALEAGTLAPPPRCVPPAADPFAAPSSDALR